MQIETVFATRAVGNMQIMDPDSNLSTFAQDQRGGRNG
jgi:hypothetical protein